MSSTYIYIERCFYEHLLKQIDVSVYTDIMSEMMFIYIHIYCIMGGQSSGLWAPNHLAPALGK